VRAQVQACGGGAHAPGGGAHAPGGGAEGPPEPGEPDRRGPPW